MNVKWRKDWQRLYFTYVQMAGLCHQFRRRMKALVSFRRAISREICRQTTEKQDAITENISGFCAYNFGMIKVFAISI